MQINPRDFYDSLRTLALSILARHTFDVPIRRARIEDHSAIVLCNAAMALETEGLHLHQATLSAGVLAILEERAPGTYWILEENSEICAQLLITYEWSDWRNRFVWWIQSVYVPLAHRGRGYFSALYRAILDEAQKAGAAGLRLYVDTRNARAQRIYESLGMDGGHYRVFERMF